MHENSDDLAHFWIANWLCFIDLLVVVLGCGQMKCNGICGVSNGQFLGGIPAASWNKGRGKGRGKRQRLWCSFRIVEMCVSVQLLAAVVYVMLTDRLFTEFHESETEKMWFPARSVIAYQYWLISSTVAAWFICSMYNLSCRMNGRQMKWQKPMHLFWVLILPGIVFANEVLSAALLLVAIYGITVNVQPSLIMPVCRMRTVT